MKSLRRGSRAGLTLIEIVMAVGVLVAIAAALASMSSASIQSSRDVSGYFLAQETALRTAERIQSEAYSQAFLLYWDTSNVTRATINGKSWAVAGGPIDELAQPMVDAAAADRIGAPLSNPAFLRIRFLNETEFSNLWGFSPGINLDYSVPALPLDSGTDEPTPNYSYVGVVIEVHWQEGPGPLNERTYQLRSLIRRNPLFDPNR